MKNVAFGLYLGAIATLPLTYAIKFMIGLPGITWVDPALLLGATALALDLFGRRDQLRIHRIDAVGLVGGIFVTFYVTSGLLNGLFGSAAPSPDIFREPGRLVLVLSLAVVTWRFARVARWRKTIYETLGVVLLVQLGFAVYLLLVPAFGIPAPTGLRSYSVDYIARQTLWSAPIPLPRLGGTFDEAPPFGLFMLSGLFAMYLYRRESGSRSALVYGAAALIGVIGSMSAQVLLGLGIAVSVIFSKHVAAARRPLIAGLLGAGTLIMSVLVGNQVADRLQAERSGPVTGQSIGERTYHARYALELSSRSPSNFLIGVGPGMYGPAVAHEGRFPPTVTPQVAPAEILAETGVVGLILCAATILALATRIGMGTGVTGIAILTGTIVAVSLQSNWKSSGLFFLLGLLLAIGRPSWIGGLDRRGREVQEGLS